MNKIDVDQERENLEALLPWHATGTLSRADKVRIEKGLAADFDLTRRLDLVREEYNETVLLNEALGAPSARAVENALAAIAAEPARKAKVPFDLAGWLASGISNFSPRALALAGSVAALAIAMQAGVITTYLVKDKAGRQGTELASARTSNGALAVIRFAANADAAEITQFLVDYKTSVVDGPKAGAIYTIRLPETGQAKDDLIKRMQTQSTIVEFVSPVR